MEPPELNFLLSPYFWAAAFVAFMVIELNTTGAIAAFMGLGALATAFLVEFQLVTSIQGVLLGWLVSTVAVAGALWVPLKRRYAGRDTTDAEEDIEPFTNDFGQVEDAPLTTSGGTIRLHGARMRAVLSSEAGVEQVEVGERVQVVRQDDDQRFVVTPAN